MEQTIFRDERRSFFALSFIANGESRREKPKPDNDRQQRPQTTNLFPRRGRQRVRRPQIRPERQQKRQRGQQQVGRGQSLKRRQ